MNVSPLRVGNEEFLVSSLIERCPKAMMLRELVKNGLESAALANEGDRRVEITFVTIGDARKLTIWNTGPGMDAEELFRMCDLASSIGKQQSLDQNFGMGAKVASLPSNQHGIRYRSCKAGLVHQVIMGKRDGVYGRVKQIGPDDVLVDVVEVTAEAEASGRSLDREWTEVVLLGNSAGQDTLADPYDGNPSVNAMWIVQELSARFFRLPADITLILGPKTHTRSGSLPFVPIGNRLDAYARHEAVPAADGIIVHYLHDMTDPKNPQRLLASEGALLPTRSYAAIVYRDEIYDLRIPYFWTREAPIYGISFGARNISVLIELPDHYPLVPDAYRQFLREAGDLQRQIASLDFAPIAMEHRPQWLLKLMEGFAPDSRHMKGVRDEVYQLFVSLGVLRRWWPKDDEVKLAQGDRKPRQARDPNAVYYEAAPEIIALHDPVDIAQRGLKEAAARFYPETHQLFVNANYASFAALKTALEREYATLEDQEAVRVAVQVAVEQTLIRQMARKLAFGLAKRDVWQDWQIDAALSSFSLTLAAEDQAETIGPARRIANEKLEAESPS